MSIEDLVKSYLDKPVSLKCKKCGSEEFSFFGKFLVCSKCNVMSDEYFL